MPTDSRRKALHAIRQRIAAAILPPPVSATLGDITLHPHQQDAVARLLEILPLHHGALLADDVGLGKTYVALAVARHYTEVHCLAPAPLCGMWQAAASRAGVHDLQVHSLHAMSRGTHHAFGDGTRVLVIIDEAHALRNPGTARYRAVAQACAGADVLLISATPVHNHADDLRALFALFAGHRADALATRRLEELIVRRRADDLQAATAQRPSVTEHPPIAMPQDRETLNRLLALPAPLPARDGAVAGALIRLGLLRAWCSSDAALAQALRRRRLRTAALRDVLRIGRHATTAELRDWIVGDDAGQLAFPELLVEHEIEHEVGQTPLLDILERHLAALTELAAHHDAIAQSDHRRSDTLRALLGRHDGTPIVAFSQFSTTVEALYRALSDIAGIAMLTGDRARIASGTVARQEVLETFAPRAHGRAPPPTHQRIRLLLTTDLLAEGVNLQDAGVVVHLDLPWTAARRAQRLGRCVRLGSPHRTVHSYRFTASREAEHHVRTEALILRKARIHRHLIGQTTDPAPTTSPVSRHTPNARSAVETVTRDRAALYALLETWRQDPITVSPAMSSPDAANVSVRVVVQRAACDGALLRAEERTANGKGHGIRYRQFVVALTPRRCRNPGEANHYAWHHRSSVPALLKLVASSVAADTADGASDDRQPRNQPSISDIGQDTWRIRVETVRRAVWREWRRMRRITNAGRAMGPRAREQRVLARRMEQQIAQVVQQLPPDARVALRLPIAQARRCAAAARGAGADAALQRWAARRVVEKAADWLIGWRTEPALCRCMRRGHDPAETRNGPNEAAPRHATRLMLRDVLLLVRDPAAVGSSPDTSLPIGGD